MPSLHPSPSTLIRQAHPNPGAPCLLPLNSQTHTFSLRQSDARGGVHLSSPLTYPPRPPPSPPHCAVSGYASAAPACACATKPSPPPHLVQCLNAQVQLPRALVLPHHSPPPPPCAVSQCANAAPVCACAPTARPPTRAGVGGRVAGRRAAAPRRRRWRNGTKTWFVWRRIGGGVWRGDQVSAQGEACRGERCSTSGRAAPTSKCSP